MPSKITGLEELVNIWAWNTFLDNCDKKHKKLHLEDLKIQINWSRLKTTTSTPEYSDQRSVLRSTDSSQDHSFQTERTTVSSCTTTVSKGFTKGMHLKVAPFYLWRGKNKNAKFKVSVRMEGSVLVLVNLRDNNSFIMSIEGEISDIMRTMTDKLDSKSVTMENRVVTWEMEGTWCRMCGVDCQLESCDLDKFPANYRRFVDSTFDGWEIEPTSNN